MEAKFVCQTFQPLEHQLMDRRTDGTDFIPSTAYARVKYVPIILAVKEYLIYAVESELRSVHLDPGTHSQPWRPITDLQGAVALDFDYADKKIFFTQVL